MDNVYCSALSTLLGILINDKSSKKTHSFWLSRISPWLCKTQCWRNTAGQAASGDKMTRWQFGLGPEWFCLKDPDLNRRLSISPTDAARHTEFHHQVVNDSSICIFLYLHSYFSNAGSFNISYPSVLQHLIDSQRWYKYICQDPTTLGTIVQAPGI